MIAARQIAFGKAAGKRKPYDAEIEYLESTTIQWIDTGVMFTDRSRTYRWEITAQSINTNNNKYRWFCGFFSPLNEDNTFNANYSAGVFGDDLSQYKFYPGLKTKYYQKGAPLSNPKEKGEKYQPVTAIWESSDVNIPLSLCLFIRVDASGGVQSPAPMRIFSFKIFVDDKKILDFIPVRKGNIGYMYDRISGQLFGNQGTGEFVLGDDL